MALLLVGGPFDALFPTAMPVAPAAVAPISMSEFGGMGHDDRYEEQRQSRMRRREQGLAVPNLNDDRDKSAIRGACIETCLDCAIDACSGKRR